MTDSTSVQSGLATLGANGWITNEAINDGPVAGTPDAGVPVFGGRLTLTTLTPVLVATVAGATSVLYSPYAGVNGGGRIAIPNGVAVLNYPFAELANVLANSAVGNAGPAAAAVSSVYDMYAWVSPTTGSRILTRSPAWATAVTRGTGAGTAEADSTTYPGLVTNAQAITNGPAAGRGTRVGTFATNAAGTVDWIYGSIAAAWGMASHMVWNQHNRVPVGGFLGDSVDSWTYQLTQIRAANGNATARVNCVMGASEDLVVIGGFMRWLSGAATVGIAGIGLDSTTSFAQTKGFGANSTMGQFPYSFSGYVGEGTHFLSANEACNAATNAVTFYGDFANPTIVQTGMTYSLRM